MRPALEALAALEIAVRGRGGALARLELVDGELMAVRQTLTDVLAAREVHRETGLYAGTAAFISRLYSRYRIGWRDFDALREDDETEIAEIVLRRVKAHPDSGGEA